MYMQQNKMIMRGSRVKTTHKYTDILYLSNRFISINGSSFVILIHNQSHKIINKYIKT